MPKIIMIFITQVDTKFESCKLKQFQCTSMIIMRKDWINKLRAKPLVNQNTIRKIFAIRRIAHTSIENDPTAAFARINRYCEQ